MSGEPNQLRIDLSPFLRGGKGQLLSFSLMLYLLLIPEFIITQELHLWIQKNKVRQHIRVLGHAKLEDSAH